MSPKMNIYLASPYKSLEIVEARAEQLRALGHIVTSRWHTRPKVDYDPTQTPKDWEAEADADLIDIARANMLVLCLEVPSLKGHGGKDFEAGYAYAAGIWVVTVGPRQNVFHFLEDITNYPSWDQFLEERTNGR